MKYFLCYFYSLCSLYVRILAQDLDFMPVPIRPISFANSADGDEHMLKQEPRCLEGVEPGTGTDTVRRFFFQPNNSSCVPFTYTGEGGNGNNFPSELECLNNCFIGVNDETPQEDEEDVHMIKQDITKLVKKNDCDNGETIMNCTSAESDDEEQR